MDGFKRPKSSSPSAKQFANDVSARDLSATDGRSSQTERSILKEKSVTPELGNMGNSATYGRQTQGENVPNSPNVSNFSRVEQGASTNSNSIPSPSPDTAPKLNSNQVSDATPTSTLGSEPIAATASSSKKSDDKISRKKPRLSRAKKWLIALIVLVFSVAIAALAAYYWYNQQLEPVSDDETLQSIVIADGESVADIASKLKQSGVIRNEQAFQLYARLNGKTDLKAGTCRVAPSQTVAEIIDKITAGCHDFKVITFYPGGTLEPSQFKASRSDDGFDKTNARYVLQQAGYSDSEITAAFNAIYDGELFADKPSDASLEGYIFGETYYVAEDATAQQVLEAVFAHMYEVVEQNDLVAKFEAQGLNLYQGLIMSSIVERELTCEDKPTAERKERCYQYQRGIAQVFISRYELGMQLGSDITAVYAADDEGIEIPQDDTSTLISIDSPYNTRKYTGLPPTPIAAPGLLSMRAVADPTDTDNLYFLAGDDGLIYFAKTDEEHEANIENHCQVLCATI